MQINVCFAYPWATLGGCERVLLNRALAFKKYLPEVHVDFCFFHDSGGLISFKNSLYHYELTSSTSVVNSLQKKYDLVSLIDCPQAIDFCVNRLQSYIVECHTGYTNNRLYLQNLPDSCKRIIAPSENFGSKISKEFPKINARLSILRNFVPWDINPRESKSINYLPLWSRKPILFFGRLDTLKDPLSLLDAFEILEKRRPGEFMLLFCGPKSPDINLTAEISNRSLDGLSVVLPPVSFNSANLLLNSVACSGGIFVSPSKAESFGLSAAESISLLLPVVLSNIDAHLKLIQGYEEFFTYPLSLNDRLADRIEYIFDNYQFGINALSMIRNNFSASAFIKDWIELIKILDDK